MKQYILITILVLLAFGAGVMFVQLQNKTPLTPQSPNNPSANNQQITNFDKCVAAGNPVMESYPPRCSANGKTFTQDIGNELEMQDQIKITSPRPNQQITSPLNISGQARGSWFFEAQAPVKLVDQTGNLLASGVIRAQGEWMTQEFVPFTTTLTFNKPQFTKGSLILEKDNPSGLPQNNKQLIIPVVFAN